MEHLTKAQIVLLTLFVSFVSSMATGIVVVTLMQQSPEPVTQTITNVVERTIEKVTPTLEKPAKTIIVKDEDLVIAAIEKNAKSVTAFRIPSEEGGTFFSGVGAIASPDGLIITDKNNFGGGVLMTTVDGVQYALELVQEGKGLLSLGRLTPVATTTRPTTLAPIALGDASTLRVGQTAIILGGRDGRSITQALITSIDTRTVVNKDTKAETKVIDSIGLSQRLTSSWNGAPIVTLSGEVVGFVSIASDGTQTGVPASVAKDLLTTPLPPVVPVKK